MVWRGLAVLRVLSAVSYCDTFEPHVELQIDDERRLGGVVFDY